MARTVRLLLAIAALVIPLQAQTAHQHHPPRDEWQKPHEVVTALELKSTDAVADIGAGTGYFSRRFARHAGKVYAVDIDAKLLEMLKKNAPANVTSVLAAADDPKLAPASADVIFFCDVLHHIESRGQYLAKLKTALRPGGRVINIDFFKKPLPVGPPPSMKLSEDEVISEFKAAGFRLVKRHEFLPYQYFLVFEL